MHEFAFCVRREKAALSSGCKAHPATAPAGSNRSSHGGNEDLGAKLDAICRKIKNDEDRREAMSLARMFLSARENAQRCAVDCEGSVHTRGPNKIIEIYVMTSARVRRAQGISAGALVVAIAVQGNSGNALSMQECSAKYNAAKEAGTLGGMKWNDFRKAQCGADATAAPSSGRPIPRITSPRLLP